jgi:hypothetical protein
MEQSMVLSSCEDRDTESQVFAPMSDADGAALFASGV